MVAKLKKEDIVDKCEICALVTLFLISILAVSPAVYAGDNHVHIDQVNDGDDLSISIDQEGYSNEIDFSIDHNGNTVILKQYGGGNKISWVPYWGSGKSWGGDIDGLNNTLAVEQHDGATYGGHIWGNSNNVDVYQNGTHTHYLHRNIKIKLNGNVILFERINDSSVSRSMHGTTRQIINNMIIGVSDGFKKDLEIVGVCLLYTSPSPRD